MVFSLKCYCTLVSKAVHVSSRREFLELNVQNSATNAFCFIVIYNFLLCVLYSFNGFPIKVIQFDKRVDIDLVSQNDVQLFLL